MFDRLTFARKNAKSVTTNVNAGGFKAKLEGYCDDTIDDLADLAARQVEEVKVTAPKVFLPNETTKTERFTFSPAKAAAFIRCEEEKPVKKVKEVIEERMTKLPAN